MCKQICKFSKKVQSRLLGYFLAEEKHGFRHDINALRAYAVIAVILFHFGIPGFTGGFAGVDIFFVISGYLMAQIIVGGLEQDNFNLWRFYMARMLRILPALLVLCAVLLLIGWLVLLPVD